MSTDTPFPQFWFKKVVDRVYLAIPFSSKKQGPTMPRLLIALQTVTLGFDTVLREPDGLVFIAVPLVRNERTHRKMILRV